MPRESADAKGRRYLGEGRLVVEQVTEAGIVATCRGMGDIYRVTYCRSGWSCDCPAMGRCSHLTALMLVTAPRSREATS